MAKNNFTPINIKRPCYTMASIENDSAEITMYGEIVETQPRDWWTDEPIDGSYIIQDEFLNDLNAVVSSGAKKLKLRMNSLGGDAGVSILIHNRLRELAQSGVELTCIVDGVAMSGGSLIMCACDHVIVNPSSLVMIHKCWSFIFGGYNADDLRAAAKQNDAWDQAQISIYNRKCGLSDTVISHMMSETTYMTGKEAVEKGFADELSEENETSIAASADRKTLFVKGRQMHLAHGMVAPDIIPTVTTAQAAVINKTSADTDSNEGGTPMARNLEELRTENPELATQVESDVRAALSAENTTAVNNATEAERNRLSEIDEIAHLFDDETVREAKYGEHPCTAQEMAFRAATKAARSGDAFMTNALKDNKMSGANNVSANPGVWEEGKEKTSEERMNEARGSVKALLVNKEG